MGRNGWKTSLVLTLLAVAVQAMAMIAVASLRGSPTAYAYQSSDSAEYVSLARGLAWRGQYVQIDGHDHPLSGPDTWRTPGYPQFLACVIRLAGDSDLTLLLAQQIIAVATIPLLYLLMRWVTSSRWSTLAVVAWAFDPFRLYYSQWLLAETLFVFVLLVTAWRWAEATDRGWTGGRAVGIGALAAAAILVRPIGIILPPLAWLGVSLAGRRQSRRHALIPALACMAGSAVVLGPWLVRNRVLTGDWVLSHQSGASFAYHKVADVVLWSQGKSAWRFDAATLDQVRSDMDRRLRQKWEQVYGPLTPAQQEALTWKNLNFGRVPGVDPLAVSSMLWSVGCELLAERKWACVQCFAVQGIAMLVFPLGLVLFPPAGAGAAPLAMLLGGSHSAMSLVLAVVIGSAYAALTLAACWRCVASLRRRPWPGHLFVVLPMLGLFLLTLPFEDPRFRLPLVPFLWLLAVANPMLAVRDRGAKGSSAGCPPVAPDGIDLSAPPWDNDH